MEKKKLSEVENLTQKLEKLKEENAALRRSVASYKSANTVLKKKVRHNREVDVEGDQMYEEKIKELANANQKIEDQNTEIKRLCDLVDTEREKFASVESERNEFKRKFKEAEELVKIHNEQPWYKRFAKI